MIFPMRDNYSNIKMTTGNVSVVDTNLRLKNETSLSIKQYKNGLNCDKNRKCLISFNGLFDSFRCVSL